MTRWILLMRGINVGGKNKLPMAALRDHLTSLGARSPRTYIQSGNAVFDADQETAERVSAELAPSIATTHGFAPPSALCRADKWTAWLQRNPFVAESAAPIDHKAHHIMLLDRPPSPSRVNTLDADRSPGDRFLVHERVVYLHCPRGVARTKLTNAWFERQLAVVSTSRNWKSAQAVDKLARG